MMFALLTTLITLVVLAALFVGKRRVNARTVLLPVRKRRPRLAPRKEGCPLGADRLLGSQRER